MKCYRHRRTHATVACGHCDRPICSECMVSAPAGMRCRECTTHPGAVTGAVDTTDRIGWAIAAALFFSLFGVILVKGLGLFGMVIGPCYGALVAELIVRILGKSQKPMYMKALGLGSVAFGAALAFSKLGVAFSFSFMTLPTNLAQMVTGLAVGLALSACYGRLRAALD